MVAGKTIKSKSGEKKSEIGTEKEKVKIETKRVKIEIEKVNQSQSKQNQKTETEEFNLNSTKDIKISSRIIDQVIGQEDAVEIIKKAALQRRHVLLIGEPGTGKSMLGLALAELLPKEKLVDVVSYPNPHDENKPLIRTVPAGKGREEVLKSRIDGARMFKNQNILMFILAIVAMIAPWWILRVYEQKLGATAAAVMFTAFFIGGMFFLVAFVMFINFGKRMPIGKEGGVPKVIVDNFKKDQAPFYDATGAHAGALLGDVLHDPFQTFFGGDKITVIDEKKGLTGITMVKLIDNIFKTPTHKILKREKNNYEAIHLPKDELFILGEKEGLVSKVEVLSTNRYDYQGEMIKITTSENKELIVTPEHKIAVWRNKIIEYIEARNIKKGDEVVSKAEDIIIDEQDIINTYNQRQQEQCRLYYQYISIKEKNPNWGYKRIAKVMGQPIGKTRWWHAKKHIPFPIQTANWLKERGLLPLTITHPKLPLIAKVIGATFGDGGVFENLNGIFLSSSEKEAVQEFGSDLEEIFNLSKDENSRIIEGGEYGHSWCYQNTNRNVIRFFLALGAPKGNKTKIELKSPGWIKLNNKLEDEFYGSFLGGELGTPIIHKQGNYLTTLEVGITGLPRLKENRIFFLNELGDYLHKNRVNTTSIYEGTSKTEGSLVFRLLIEKKMDNVLLFLININLNYCKYKVDRLYKALGEWAMLKKNKYNELINRGYGAEHAMKVLNLTPNSLYLLLNHFELKEVTA
ncbi:ATP-binding protein [Candidatus Woesearchaeota archaeon]|nr:ATP-binding protein [Candidatus Woesearchaeota archaeon]